VVLALADTARPSHCRDDTAAGAGILLLAGDSPVAARAEHFRHAPALRQAPGAGELAAFGPLSSGESQRIAGRGTLREPHCTDNRQVFPR
jgi:hypothetical protein